MTQTTSVAFLRRQTLQDAHCDGVVCLTREISKETMLLLKTVPQPLSLLGEAEMMIITDV